jgi:NADPH:quinone reductase-like Zn-dependent oxidoreductase
VLVRVHAVAVSAAELTQPATEKQARPPSIPGRELSGVVQSMPRKVPGIAVGDAVYGLTDSRRDLAAADHVCMRASELAPKPRTVDHVGAAALVLAGLTAWQGLFDHARLASGQRVLILGAAGAVGAVAVQLAHWRRAHVIGTACARHRDFLRGLGADEVIDPTSARFDDKGWDADVVLDVVGGNALDRPRRVIRPGGLLVTLDGSAPTGPLALEGVRVISFTVQPNRAQLVELARLVDGGVVAPIVEHVFPLAQAREAFRREAEGSTRGKLVLRVVEGDRSTDNGGSRGRAAAPRFAERRLR